MTATRYAVTRWLDLEIAREEGGPFPHLCDGDEYQIRTSDGTEHTAIYSGRALRDEAGEPYDVVAIRTDKAAP